MAHGGEEGAFGAVGFVGSFLGGAKLVEQLTSFADVDPATDDALNFTDGIAVGKDPVVDRQFLSTNMQVRSTIIGLPSATTR